MRVFFVLGVFVFLSVSCTARKDRATSSLLVAVPKDPQTLDSAVAENQEAWWILSHLQSGLVAIDSGKPVPSLASRWELKKGKILRFELSSSKWSDGVPLTAHDFVEAWKRVLDPRRRSVHASLLFDVRGAEAFHSGKDKFGAVGIRAPTSQILEVELVAGKSDTFIQKLPLPPLYPVRGDVIDSHPATFADPPHLRSIGPFRLARWERGRKLVLIPNPYYSEPPKTAEIVFLVSPDESDNRARYAESQFHAVLLARNGGRMIASSWDLEILVQPSVREVSSGAWGVLSFARARLGS